MKNDKYNKIYFICEINLEHPVYCVFIQLRYPGFFFLCRNSISLSYSYEIQR